MFLPSTKVTLNDIVCDRRSFRLCQLTPQFLYIGSQVFVLEPLMETLLISPLPPTLDIITMLKFACPFNVKRTPPLLLHATLQNYRISGTELQFCLRLSRQNSVDLNFFYLMQILFVFTNPLKGWSYSSTYDS